MSRNVGTELPFYAT